MDEGKGEGKGKGEGFVTITVASPAETGPTGVTVQDLLDAGERVAAVARQATKRPDIGLSDVAVKADAVPSVRYHGTVRADASGARRERPGTEAG